MAWNRENAAAEQILLGQLNWNRKSYLMEMRKSFVSFYDRSFY